MKIIGEVRGKAVFYSSISETVTVYGNHVRIVNVHNEKEAVAVARRNLKNFKATRR